MPKGNPLPIKERLLQHRRITSAGCWEWTASLGSNGYGQMAMECEDGKWRPRRVHRIAYEEFVGPIPAGLDVCHKCDNRRCFFYRHLFLGTRADNMQDASAKGRTRNTNMGKTHCVHGHEFTPENTTWFEGHRQCKACKSDHSRRQAATRRQRYAEDAEYRERLLAQRRESHRRTTEKTRLSMPTRACADCGGPILGRKSSAMYCSDVCRYRAWKKRQPTD